MKKNFNVMPNIVVASDLITDLDPLGIKPPTPAMYWPSEQTGISVVGGFENDLIAVCTTTPV